MECPHCNEELEFNGDFYDSEADLYHNEVTGSVTITLVCANCFNDLGEYEFELTIDIDDFIEFHNDAVDHDVHVELSEECFETTVDNNTLYLGATAVVTISCICGAVTNYVYSQFELASEIMEELID